MPRCYTLALLGLVFGGCGADPPGAFVGSWRDEPTDTAAFSRQFTFAPDGHLEIALDRPAPLADTSFIATYEIERDSVLTVADVRGSEQFIAFVNGDTLVLRDAEGYSSHLYRHTD